jgi:NDP-sugar pyrophosphorylase family protein
LQAVILAAGENVRLLEAAIERFHKPFVEIEQEPLIYTLVKTVSLHVDRIVIVCSIENVHLMHELFGDDGMIRLVIQPEPIGPGDALMRGLECVHQTDQAIILCADNIIKREDMDAVVREARAHPGLVFTTRDVDPDEAERFARYRDREFFEGPLNDKSPRTSGKYVVWIGPVVVSSPRQLAAILEEHRTRYRVVRITPAFNEYLQIHGNGGFQMRSAAIGGSAVDIGTPEALAAAQA